MGKMLKAEQGKLETEVQKVIALEVNSRKQADSPQRANIDRVGSRARLERQEDPIFESVQAHIETDSEAHMTEDVMEGDLLDRGEKMGLHESEAAEETDDLT